MRMLISYLNYWFELYNRKSLKKSCKIKLLHSCNN